MNSLKNMAKMEDEVSTISRIYRNKMTNITFLKHSQLINSIRYIHRVDDALSSLDEEYRTLINNDFIKPCTPQWWKTIYTSKHYVTMRYKAVSSFLMHFYDF